MLSKHAVTTLLLILSTIIGCAASTTTVELLKDRSPAPGFTVQTTAGSTFSLAQQQGKVVVLFFTSVGCTVCSHQLPEMARFYNDYRDKPLQMLAVNAFPQYSQAEFLAYMAKNNGGDHLYVADQGPSVAGTYQIQSTGITVIIDKQGRIAAKALPPGLDYAGLKSAVDQLLQ